MDFPVLLRHHSTSERWRFCSHSETVENANKLIMKHIPKQDKFNDVSDRRITVQTEQKVQREKSTSTHLRRGFMRTSLDFAFAVGHCTSITSAFFVERPAKAIDLHQGLVHSRRPFPKTRMPQKAETDGDGIHRRRLLYACL